MLTCGTSKVIGDEDELGTFKEAISIASASNMR